MRTLHFLIIPAVFIAGCSTEPSSEAYTYPDTRKVDTVTDYFGTKITDPYRWLEDDNSEETRQWVIAQNKVTDSFLAKIPYREEIRKRLTGIWNYEKFSAPFKKGKYYFYYKNNGIQNQSVLYYREGIGGEEKMLLDPNALSADGTVSLAGIAFSKGARYMAYGISKAGSDWNEWYVMEVATGKKLDDKLEWIKFSGVAWMGDGFYYSRYEKPAEGDALKGKNTNNRLYFHRLGDAQEKDELIYEDTEHTLWSFSPQVTDDEKWLIVYISESTSGNAVMIRPLIAKGPWIHLVENFENEYGFIDHVNGGLLCITNKNAPMNKLVRINPSQKEENNWITILPEKKELLESVSIMGDKLVSKYQVDVTHRMFIHGIDGKQTGEIPVNGLATAGSFNSDKEDSLAFYSITTFTAPATIYKYNHTTGKSTVFAKPDIDFNSEDYETKQVFFPSKDGTKIPMFITHKKGINMDGSNPCFLYGYGGFNISLTPEFRIDRAVFLEKGGIYAVANMRGGGEYGEVWHKAGTKCSKQNVFDDFIAAAEYLVREKYTSHDKLAIHGRSNGGLLIGAVLTQRPDIAKVALPVVGVLDMLRYQYFTIGRYWSVDYGTSENQEEFNCLVKYSPLHNVREIEYPCTLIMTGDHDDRVVPAHSFKFAAELQSKHKGKHPVMIRIDTNAGHGAGKPTAKQIEEFSDMWSFVFYNLGVEYK
ncbi:MAG: S9 family peptidase [Bacteroidia bacterium]|nr:S9 family peptidase [Bacteroidia bacterium]